MGLSYPVPIMHGMRREGINFPNRSSHPVVPKLFSPPAATSFGVTTSCCTIDVPHNDYANLETLHLISNVVIHLISSAMPIPANLSASLLEWE